MASGVKLSEGEPVFDEVERAELFSLDEVDHVLDVLTTRRGFPLERLYVEEILE